MPLSVPPVHKRSCDKPGVTTNKWTHDFLRKLMPVVVQKLMRILYSSEWCFDSNCTASVLPSLSIFVLKFVLVLKICMVQKNCFLIINLVNNYLIIIMCGIWKYFELCTSPYHSQEANWLEFASAVEWLESHMEAPSKIVEITCPISVNQWRAFIHQCISLKQTTYLYKKKKAYK